MRLFYCSFDDLNHENIMLEIGQKAPDFKLINTDRKEVTLENFKGKNLVFFFFPMAWTSTCTKQMCTVQEDYSVYSELNTEVVWRRL